MSNAVQNSRRVTRQKIKRRLFNSLNITKHDYDRRADSFKDRRGQWSQDSGDSDIKACFDSLNIQLRTV